MESKTENMAVLTEDTPVTLENTTETRETLVGIISRFFLRDDMKNKYPIISKRVHQWTYMRKKPGLATI